MGDTGGKSGRRPARHPQVEASGPGNATSALCRLGGRVGGRRCDLEVTGWGLGRPIACILQSRSRWGLRRIGVEPGPENAPSAIFSVAGEEPLARAPGGQRARSRLWRSDWISAQVGCRCGGLPFGTCVKSLARPQARLPSPSPLSVVSKTFSQLLARAFSCTPA